VQLRRERPRVHTFEAIDTFTPAIRVPSGIWPTEWLWIPQVAAEEVLDRPRAEPLLRHRLRAPLQREAARERREGQHRAEPAAARAIADHHLVEVEIRLLGDRPPHWQRP
jgi:hypothetical protein